MFLGEQNLSSFISFVTSESVLLVQYINKYRHLKVLSLLLMTLWSSFSKMSIDIIAIIIGKLVTDIYGRDCYENT
jgi:hypothetical protein